MFLLGKKKYIPLKMCSCVEPKLFWNLSRECVSSCMVNSNPLDMCSCLDVENQTSFRIGVVVLVGQLKPNLSAWIVEIKPLWKCVPARIVAAWSEQLFSLMIACLCKIGFIVPAIFYCNLEPLLCRFKLGFPFVRESANKKVRTRTRISTNCSFADVEKSANKMYFF